jgi:virulence-associated protein VagC
MKARVTQKGVTIPKALLEGVDAVEVRREDDVIVVVPLVDDPILGLGSQPVDSDITDASENHDAYLY